jgi:tetratricopeptide (TPR) repeat protein
LAALASLEAARQATRRLGHDDAVRHYERALTAIPDARRAELLLELARSLDRAGRFPSARLRYLDAVDLARRTGDTTALAVAALGLHALGARSGASVREVVALLEEADAHLGDAHPALHSRVLAARARAGHHAATASADPELTAIAARAVRLAEASADPAALAVARLAEHDVAWARGTAEVRLPIATGMLAAARAADDPELVAQGHLLRATALLELGDPAGRDALLTYVAHAEQLGSARGRWGALTRRATYAQLAGRVEEAVRLGEDALALGRAAGEPDAVGCFCTQRWSLVALGVREPDEPMLADEVDPLWPMVPLMRAWPHAARGDREGARAALGNFSVLDILPTHDLEGLAVAAVVFAVAGDDSQRCWAYEQLAPYAGTHVVVGGCAAYHAAVDHHLGVLAAARGDDALAERHLRAALTMHRRIGAAAWASVTERELDALGARRPVDEFRRVDDRWLLVFGGRACTMADAKGLGDLHRILAADGAEIHVLDLLGPEVRGRVGPTGADPVLDARARAEYRRRLDVLADEVAHAEAAGDAERSDRAERERHALLHELAAATGLGGRDRRLGDATERARKTVGARIRDTLARMEQVHPELAAHLRSAVHLGTTCRYAPPDPVAWRLGG